jgi:hypothetical protein
MPEFESLTANIHEKIFVNKEESRILVRVRDILLPRLMRGEICIKDVEKIL